MWQNISTYPYKFYKVLFYSSKYQPRVLIIIILYSIACPNFVWNLCPKCNLFFAALVIISKSFWELHFHPNPLTHTPPSISRRLKNIFEASINIVFHVLFVHFTHFSKICYFVKYFFYFFKHWLGHLPVFIKHGCWYINILYNTFLDVPLP